MLRTIARAFQVLLIASTLMTAAAAWAADALDASITFKISAQSLQNALLELSRQSSCQIVFSDAAYADLRAPAIVGTMPVRQALDRLLSGTDLGYKLIGDNTITIARQPNSGRSAPVDGSDRVAPRNGSGADAGQRHLDQSGSVPQSGAALPDSRSDAPSPHEILPSVGLEEIVVTAQKRAERLQDVPVPVTAISGASLVSTHQLRIQDYSSSIPGLSVAPGAVQGIQTLSIRSITTGGGSNPTVGIVVDDVPYGASTALAGGLTIPDLDPSDLARVEVLRGPQGTLYGASSMGGLLKYVTVDPSTERTSGQIQAGLTGVHNGAEAGYDVRGSVNLPIGDTFAIRASGFTRQDPGYIDNPVLGIDGVNEDRVSGGRLSSMWKPFDDLSVKLSALYQQARGDGSSDVDIPTVGYPDTAGLGDLQQNHVRGSGAYDRKVQAYSAIVNARLGTAQLTAASGYNINAFRDSWDYSFQLGGATQPLYGVDGAPVFDNSRTQKFTQEIRLSTALGPHFDWLAGAFYTHEASSFTQDIAAANRVTGAVVADRLIFLSFPAVYSEYAGFSDLTYHLTDRFDIQVGARESHIVQTSSETEEGPFVGPTPVIDAERRSDSNAFTYLVTPSWKLSPDLMVYARLASGYRAGGPNLNPGGDVPAQFQPDRTYDYEIGLKGKLAEASLSFDASLYHIDWKDIQIQLFSQQSGLDYNTNGSRAKSDGLELSLESRPLGGLTLAAWVVWNDAVLTQAFPPNTTAYGVPGDRLPYSARFTGTVSAQQDFALPKNATGYVGLAANYVGDRQDVFTSQPPAIPPRQDLPSYAKVDLRAGAKVDSWSINLFLNNAFDRRGVVTGGLGNVPPFSLVYIQPRTAGFSVSRAF